MTGVTPAPGLVEVPVPGVLAGSVTTPASAAATALPIPHALEDDPA